MATAARRENKDPYEIARYYEDAFVRDLERLGISARTCCRAPPSTCRR
jgi:hypothetical protein